MSLGSSPHLASIHVYPLKSGRAVDLPGSRVEPWGLAGDRRWLVVDGTGRFVTQRAEPALALVTAGYLCQPPPACGGPASGPLAAGALTLSAPGHPVLTVPAPAQQRGAEMLWVTVWRSRVRAAAAGSRADEWLSGFLGRAVRLVHLDDPTRRGVDPSSVPRRAPASFADGYPLLLTTTGSLDALCRWLMQEGHPAVPMNRFRPNVVVAGAAGPRTAGAASRSGAPRRSGSPSPAAAAWSPPSTRRPRSAAGSCSTCSAAVAASASNWCSART